MQKCRNAKIQNCPNVNTAVARLFVTCGAQSN
jgi:hypothetical protein